MNIKDKWRSLNIGLKFTIVITSIIAVLLIAFGLIVHSHNKESREEILVENMQAHVDDLHAMLEQNHKYSSDHVKGVLNMAVAGFSSEGILSIDTNTVSISVTDQVSQTSHNIDLEPLSVDNIPLWNNFTIVDNIIANTGVASTIFQRIDQGFLRISSAERDGRGRRRTGTYIPDTSPVVRTIMDGEIYIGRESINDDQFITAYAPVLIDDIARGMIRIVIPGKELLYYEERLNQVSYFEDGYALIIDSEGNFQSHPFEKGKNISGTDLYASVQRLKEGNIDYMWPETGQDRYERILFFRYSEPYDVYVAASISKDEVLGKPSAAFANILFVSSLVFIIILFFVVNRFSLNLITDPVKQISSILEKLSLRKQIDKVETYHKDEFGTIFISLNKLIEGFKETADFAVEIKNKNFDHEFTPLSDDDLLGNALLDMRENLKKAEQEEKKRKAEDDKRSWTTHGIAKFGDILRQDFSDISEISSNIIKNLVDYLGANQGGLFILNDEDANHKFLEQTACYAYDRHKFHKKSIEIGEGVTGTCFLEKKTIHLKEIPQGYTSITSGLGEATPNSLLVVPLTLNDQVYGVVELASFKEFEDHEIEFVEKIGQNIATTISRVKINVQTTKLLEESKQKTDELTSQEEELRQNMEELQATQEDLAREKNLMDSLMGNIPDHIYFKDKESKFILVSRSMAEKMGFSGPNELKGKSDFDIFTDEHAMPAYEDEQAIMRTGKPILNKMEKETYDDGRDVYVSTTKMPLRDSDGEIVGTFGISRDVTEVKEKEIEAQRKTEEVNIKREELRLMEAEANNKSLILEGIAGNLPVIIYRTDMDGSFSEFWGAGLYLKGKKEKNFIGKKAVEIYPAIEEATKMADEFSFIEKGKTDNKEWHLKHIIYPDKKGQGAYIGYAYQVEVAVNV